jgi:hypothetical protein
MILNKYLINNTAFKDKKSQIQTFAKMMLIKNNMYCDKCPEQKKMCLISKKSKYDGFIWRCTLECVALNSIRLGSCFSNLKLSFKEIFIIMYKYLKKSTFIDIAWELNITRKTVFHYTEKIREVFINYVEETSEKIGGYDANGDTKVVEIDESLFFKSKYNRGRHISGQ